MTRSFVTLLPFLSLALLTMGFSEGGCATTTQGSAQKEEVAAAPKPVELSVTCPHVESMCPMIYEPVTCTLRAGGEARQVHNAGNACEGRNALARAWCERPDAEQYGPIVVECVPATD